MGNGVPYQIPHDRPVAHVHFVNRQTQALGRPATRRNRPAQHRLNAVDILVQLLFLLDLGLRILLRPSYQLILALSTPVHKRPLKELLHVLPPHLARPRAQKPPADIVLGMRDPVPALPEQRFPVFFLEQRRVLC